MTGSHANITAALADRYTIERELGRGGMATVYLAHDIKHDRKVAVKVLRPELAATLGAERFLREIKIAAGLNHPNILAVFDSGKADRRTVGQADSATLSEFLYYVMPFVEGESLRDRLNRERQLPIEDVLSLTREVASALSCAHEQGIIHRDIKPENILISATGALVADFGIARAVSQAGGERLTETGIAVGTPAYMSPEQATAEGADTRTDIYSLGCVVYEMLGGEPPYTGSTPTAVLARKLTDPVPSLQAVRQVVSGDLEAAVAKALAREPVDRYATVGEFAQSLSDAADSVGSYAGPSGRKASIAQRVRRRAWVGGLAGSLILTVLLWTWVFSPRMSSDESAISLDAFAVFPFCVSGDAELEHWSEDLPILLSMTLDGVAGLRKIGPNLIVTAATRESVGCRDPEAAASIAERYGAGLYVLGNVFAVGGSIRVDASLYQSGSGMTSSAQAEVETEERFDAVIDTLARELIAERLANQDAQLGALAARTTDSPEALGAWLEGEAAYGEGDFQGAAVSYSRAVEIDSAFALAWFRLGWTLWGQTLDNEPGRRAIRNALLHRDALPNRERLMLEAFDAWTRGAVNEAERLYRSLLETYPDNVEALLQLGGILGHNNPVRGRSGAEARQVYERLLDLDPENPDAHLQLASRAAGEGKLEEHTSLIRRLREISPAQPWIWPVAIVGPFASGDTESQRSFLTEALTKPDALVLAAVENVAAVSRDFGGAVELLRIAADESRSPQSRGLAHINLAYVYQAQGMLIDARRELQIATDLGQPDALLHEAALSMVPMSGALSGDVSDIRRALENAVQPDVATTPLGAAFALLRHYLLAHFCLRQQEFENAREHASALAALLEESPAPSLVRDMSHGVLSEIALRSGDSVEALQLIEGATFETAFPLMYESPFHSRVHERFLMAELLRATGRGEEAVRWYASIGEKYLFDLPYVAASQLALAEFYEARGDYDQAAVHYERFVEMWADADPELMPRVEEARRRMMRLRGASAR